jgi:cobyrinic acid a,c-diamide synthase
MTVALLIAAPGLRPGQDHRGRRVGAAACAPRPARALLQVRPDYLDPLWLAAGQRPPVDPLDLWINGEADCAQRLAAAAAEADLIIVEGVMGLFDGEPSAADLAQRFGIPVLAVIDAAAMAGTFAAVAHGLHTWRPACPGPACWPTAWAARAMPTCCAGALSRCLVMRQGSPAAAGDASAARAPPGPDHAGRIGRR